MGHQGEVIDLPARREREVERLLKAAMLQLGAYADELSFKDTIGNLANPTLYAQPPSFCGIQQIPTTMDTPASDTSLCLALGGCVEWSIGGIGCAARILAGIVVRTPSPRSRLANPCPETGPISEPCSSAAGSHRTLSSMLLRQRIA